MGAMQSQQAEGPSGDMIELFFLKAGRPRTLRPGERLIHEGQQVPSVFLVTAGELVLKKKQEKNRKDKVVGGSRFKGALLGELSLLLGQPATVSVDAAAQGETPASVLEIAQGELVSMLQRDPKMAGGFFRLLGGTLGERTTEISSSMRKAVINTGHAAMNAAGGGAVTVLPASLDRSVSEVAEEFGLPADAEVGPCVLLHARARVHAAAAASPAIARHRPPSPAIARHRPPSPISRFV